MPHFQLLLQLLLLLLLFPHLGNEIAPNFRAVQFLLFLNVKRGTTEEEEEKNKAFRPLALLSLSMPPFACYSCGALLGNVTKSTWLPQNERFIPT